MTKWTFNFQLRIQSNKSGNSLENTLLQSASDLVIWYFFSHMYSCRAAPIAKESVRVFPCPRLTCRLAWNQDPSIQLV